MVQRYLWLAAESASDVSIEDSEYVAGRSDEVNLFNSPHIITQVYECCDFVNDGLQVPLHDVSANLSSDAFSKPFAGISLWKHINNLMCLQAGYVSTVLYSDGGVLTGQSE
jgi:hypothetical protein